MKTLLLRLAAPIQSWGLNSKFNLRSSERTPTKSAIIGFLAAALGVPREEDKRIQALAQSLRFGVRTDAPGSLLRDFHTARHPSIKTRAYITTRYYLSDAVFLVGLESEQKHVLNTLHEAIVNPAFPLYFGRRSCVPMGRISLGIREKTLEKALEEEPWLAANWYKKQHKNKHEVKLNLTLDSPTEAGYLQRDCAQSFNPAHRKYGFRKVLSQTDAVIVINDSAVDKGASTHDPMLTIETLDG